MNSRPPQRARSKSPGRSLLAALAWGVLQAGTFILAFEFGRRVASGHFATDTETALYWQYYAILFVALVFIGNVWIAQKRIDEKPGQRLGVWLGVLLVLLFFSRVHIDPRGNAVLLMLACSVVSIAIRERLAIRYSRHTMHAGQGPHRKNT